MKAIPAQTMQPGSETGAMVEIGPNLFLVKRGADSLRTVRAGVMDMAYALAAHPAKHGHLVFADGVLSRERLADEWTRAAMVLHPKLRSRFYVGLASGDRLLDISSGSSEETKGLLMNEVVKARQGLDVVRTDFEFVIIKLLIHQWLVVGTPVTSDWLAKNAGCTYPTVAKVLNTLKPILLRTTDRRVSLACFPKEAFNRMVVNAVRSRSEERYVDRSGSPRRPEDYRRRLGKVMPDGLAVGGVLGARHYFPELDLVGAPRLDLSLHCPGRRMDHRWLSRLDPALRPSPYDEPASVVLHAVRHANPLFQKSDSPVAWADPVECLLDLYQAGLLAQAAQFQAVLINRRPKLAL